MTAEPVVARAAPTVQGPAPAAARPPVADPPRGPAAPSATATSARPRGRSRALSPRATAAALLAVAAFIGYVVWADLGWASRDVWPLLTLYTTLAALTTAIMVSGVRWRRFDHLPVARGRVLAIVPVFNEEPALVEAAVRALLDQSVAPDEVHVVDDGSEPPLATTPLPGVTWHRQANAGKREAQASVLRAADPGRWDYVLTVDSDSVLDVDACEHLLRSMSDERTMAATGMILVRNRRRNLLTRLVDINVVSSCLMFRMLRSWFGVVTPTSGALALYRAGLVFDNLDDYVSSGTAGDDRRLSFYALLRGRVVGVTEAVVETELPTTVSQTFRQRMRWSKSAWLGIPFVSTNLRGLVLFFYFYPLVFALVWPFVVALLAAVWIVHDTPGILYGFLYWEVVAVAMTWIYAAYRPDLSWRERVGAVLLAPLYPLFGALVLRPASYWALTKLRSTSWHTR